MYKSGYEVCAVIVLVLVGALFLIWDNPPQESYSELSAPSLTDASR